MCVCVCVCVCARACMCVCVCAYVSSQVYAIFKQVHLNHNNLSIISPMWIYVYSRCWMSLEKLTRFQLHETSLCLEHRQRTDQRNIVTINI